MPVAGALYSCPELYSQSLASAQAIEAGLTRRALPCAHMSQRTARHSGRQRARAIGVLLIALAFSLPYAAATQKPPAPPPNVVVLVIDDTRWDSIGAAGNRIVRTPRLDRLAAEGVRFAQARVDDLNLHGEPRHAADRAVHVAARHRPVRQTTHPRSVRHDLSGPAA